MVIQLWWYLLVAIGLFTIGLFGAMTRRNAVNVLMGIELMLNAVNLNAVAFWRYVSPTRTLATVDAAGETGVGEFIASMDGQVFALMIIALAAAEAAVGLALIIAIYRKRKTVRLEDFTLMKG